MEVQGNPARLTGEISGKSRQTADDTMNLEQFADRTFDEATCREFLSFGVTESEAAPALRAFERFLSAGVSPPAACRLAVEAMIDMLNNA